MIAVVIVWLASTQLTVTLESKPLSRAGCASKLATMVSTVKASGLDYEIRLAKCERSRRR
jgi:hypothetical protein